MPTASDVLKYGQALAGENEAVLGSNNTSVNKYFNAKGQAYCGYFLWYCAKKAGSNMWSGCANPAYVPTVKSFFAAKKVPNSQARKGDIFAYKDQHVGFVFAPYSGNTVITLEGNSTVYQTEGQARASTAGTGAYEGIGYKKRTLDSSYTVYRPVYDGAEPETHDNKVGPACAVTLNLVKSGHSGPMVKTIQRICYSYGVKGADGKPISADGEYGANTAYAVKTLQAKLGVAADGEVGNDTWAAILTKLW